MVKAQESSDMKAPMVLNKILMPVVRLMALDPSVCLVEGFDSIWVTFRLQRVPIEVIPKAIWILSLISDDHVVQRMFP